MEDWISCTEENEAAAVEVDDDGKLSVGRGIYWSKEANESVGCWVERDVFGEGEWWSWVVMMITGDFWGWG